MRVEICFDTIKYLVSILFSLQCFFIIDASVSSPIDPIAYIGCLNPKEFKSVKTFDGPPPTH